MFPFAQSGGAKPIAAMGTDAGRLASARGGLEGGTPPHRFKARTAAFDGHNAFTRAARSAGLNFAVILLSKAMDVGRDHLIHRKRSPFPYEGKALTPRKVSDTALANATLLKLRRAERCRAAGGAKPNAARRYAAVGWVGGVYPSAQIQGADSGFRRTIGIHPRPRVSARLNFAVRSLSKAMDREINKVRCLCWHLIHR